MFGKSTFVLWRCGPTRAMASSTLRFSWSQRHTTVGRTPLGEWSACRRDLYLPTHDTNNRHISVPPGGFEPTISASAAAADLHLRPCSYWDRQIDVVNTHTHTKISKCSFINLLLPRMVNICQSNSEIKISVNCISCLLSLYKLTENTYILFLFQKTLLYLISIRTLSL